ncbi:MAG: FHA domain-containing protein [Coriobacteriia bacterium]|nr:FHA domain-containing protein [Coriobacteriia bacterium]
MVPSADSNPLSRMGSKGSTGGTIVGIAGMYKYATINVQQGEALIFGRDAVLSHLVIDQNAEKVSRKHCEVEFLTDGANWQVTDYSTNGTFLADGTRLEKNKPIRLPSGTEIYLGTKKNRFLLSTYTELTESLLTRRFDQ